MEKERYNEYKEWYDNPNHIGFKKSNWYDFVSWINRGVFEQKTSVEFNIVKGEESKRKGLKGGLFTRSMIKEIKSTTKFEECIIEGSKPVLEETFKVIMIFVKHLIKRFHPSNKQPFMDICWDCFTHLYLNSFFARYDSSVGSVWTYLSSGVIFFLIDLERKGVKNQNLVWDSELAISLLDNNSDPNTNLKRNKILFWLENIRPEIIGSINFRTNPKYVQISKTQKVILSEYIVIHLYLAGYTKKAISTFFKVSPKYISILYNRGVQLLKRNKSSFNLDYNDPSEYIYDARLLRLISSLKNHNH